MRIKVARIFNTYGPRMHPNDGRVVSNFIVQALLGDDITIYGDGAQTRSFCYVDDLIEAMMRLMATDDDFTGPVNIGNPGEFTIHELAAGVLQLTGSTQQARLQAAADGRSQAAPARHRLSPGRCWAGSRGCSWPKASKRRSNIFATGC